MRVSPAPRVSMAHRAIKVVHVIAPVAFGGGESLLVNLLGERRAGLDEAVLVLYASAPFVDRLRERGIASRTFQAARLGHGRSRARAGLGAVRMLLRLPRLRALLRELAPDIVHAHGFPASLLAALLKGAVAARAVYTHHSLRAAPAAAERRAFTWIYRRFEARTSVSAAASRSMEAAFPDAGGFRTIHNCVGEPFYDAAPDPAYMASWPPGRTVFVQIARFSALKNQRLVVDGLARLAPEERDRMLVVFAGDGPERAAVERQAAERGVAGSVRFLGAVPYERVPGLVAAADYGLFPSEAEGFGLGAAECLAAARPVVCFDTELMREVVGAGGILAPRGRLEDGLRRALATGRELRRAARQEADRYRPSRIKDQYLDLYRDVLERKE